MKPSEIKQLNIGDKIWWDDPDLECSRYYVVKRVKYSSSGVVRIEEIDGSVLECLPQELFLKNPNR